MPSALYLLGWALVLLVVLVVLGWLLAKVVHDDGIGRADSGVSRWPARERTDDLNDVTRWTTLLSETITVTVLAVLTVVIAAWLWRRWREPMRARSTVIRGLALALAVVVPLAVGLARLYWGMHYLTDVLGGVLLGSAWLLATVHGIRLGVAHRELRHGSSRGPSGHG